MLVVEKRNIEDHEEGVNQILKITIDGMDQAKFRVPRNLAASSQWDS